MQRVGDESEGDAVGFNPRPERLFAVRFDHVDVSVAASNEAYSLICAWRPTVVVVGRFDAVRPDGTADAQADRVRL